ncbi:MAG: hypothetical protein ACKVQS_11675 [Fimbriimonadaceae bacterium]
MRRLAVLLGIGLIVGAQAQNFRFGWRDEIISTRIPENLNASAIDSSGNLVVAGTVQLAANQVDVLVRKYDPLGVKIWEQKFDIGGLKLVDSVQGVVINSKNEIVISAGTPKNGFDNFVLIKLAPTDGRVIFQNVLDTGTSRATATSIALDPVSGGYIQTGGFGRNAREEFIIVKWSDSGEVVWKKTWTNGIKGDRSAKSVVVGSNGDIFAAGYSATEKYSQDSAVLKLSPTGDVLWATVFRGGDFPTNDSARCASPDSSGDLYVGGDEYVTGSRNSAYLAKLSGTEGNVIWKSDVLEPRGMDGATVAVQYTERGAVAAVQMNPTSAGGFDLAVLKFDLSGKEAWRTVVDGGAGNNEEIAGLVIDHYGSIYIAGGSVGSDRITKYMVACVDPLGKISWQYRDTGSLAALPANVSMSSDSGHVFVVGSKSRGVDDDLGIITLFQAPRATADRYTVYVGEKLSVDSVSGVLSNDIFWRFADLKLASSTKSGTLEFSVDGGFVFTAPTTPGEISFEYELSRDGLTSSKGLVTISVVKKPGSQSDEYNP